VACCTFVNHYSLYRGFEDRIPFDSFDHVFVDGALLAWQLSNKLRVKIRRVSFDASSVAWRWLTGAVQRGYCLRIVGGSASDAAAFQRHLGRSIKEFRADESDIVDGYRDFDPVAAVRRLDPLRRHLVIFGTGTPLQEMQAVTMAAAMRDAAMHGVVLTCGGFITQTAMAIDSGGRFYPAWVEKLGVRWLYRAAKQPYVLGRLLKVYPKSFVMVSRAQI
jgi:N-acetylglucosaminyldiphosphoundecaprenol N-acetyl-beta-D-mannosaminyltransferase